MSTDVSGCVLVPLERLRALEALEASLSTRIETGVIEAGKKRLADLNAKKKANPSETAKVALTKYHKNKDEINQRRREAYKAKKEAESKNVN